MKKYIEIKGDCNDGDLISERSEITDEQIEYILPVIEAIKNCQEDHNWPTLEWGDDSPLSLYEDILTEEQIDVFGDFVPYGETGIHTIHSITILHVTKEEKLL